MDRRSWRRWNPYCKLGMVAGLLAVGLLLACVPPPQVAVPTSGSQPGVGTSPSGRAAASVGPAAPPPAAPPAPMPLKVGYSELTTAQAPNWVAEEAGINAKHGIDAELLYVQSSQTVAAIMAGDVDVAIGGGGAAVNSRLGGSDLVIFFALMDYYPFEFFVSPDVAEPGDLRGKTVGISRFGSTSDMATRVALQHFGLVPNRDVTLIQLGSLPERVAAMQAGQLAGAVSSPPYNTALRRMGLRSILDLAKTGEPALNNVGFARASWLRENPAAAQAFLNAIVEGIHHVKTNREYAERILVQYLKLDDTAAVADAYDYYLGENMPRLPELSIEAGRKYLEDQAASDPRAATANVADFFDNSFLERTKASGLVERLYGAN